MSKKVTIPTCMDPFIVMVNGVNYSYPAGQTLEVPDEVALVIERHWSKHERQPSGTQTPFAGGGVDVTAQVGQTIMVKEVDSNGKPTKWEAVDYQERTHWSEEGQEDIVPELTFTPLLNETIGVYQHNLALFELVEGKTYTVIFDGMEYSCTAKTATLDGIECIFIGNGALVGENTGEPFAILIGSMIAYPNGSTAPIVTNRVSKVLSFDGNEHTVRVIEDKIVPHKVPEEYVTPCVFEVIVFSKYGETPPLALATPWEHIIEAVKSGKVIVMRMAVYDYEFDPYGNPLPYYMASTHVCTEAKVGIYTLECSLKFLTPSSTGTVGYVTIARDKDGVTTID